MKFYKQGPSSYSYEIINNGLIKVGIHSSGYDEFEYIGNDSLKITKTESYIADEDFWNSKIASLTSANINQSTITSSSYVLSAVNVDGSLIKFEDDPSNVYSKGSLTFFKYRKTGGAYTGDLEIENTNRNREILQYTIDGTPIIADYKGITKTRTYSTNANTLPVAGTKIGSNSGNGTLLQSVSTSDHKVVNGSVWKKVSVTEIVY